MRALTISGLVFFGLLSGCSSAPVAPTSDQVTEVAAISKEIRLAPDKAEETLTAHGLDAAKFDTLMYEIAADPKKSADYAAATK
jgi:hypothetical protein